MSASFGRPILTRALIGRTVIAVAGILAAVATVVAVLNAFGSGALREGAIPRPDASIGRVAGHFGAEREVEMRRAFDEGVSMMQQRRFQEAADAFHRVLVLDPYRPEAHLNMGFAFFELGRYAAARDFFRSTLSLAPRQANGYYGRALALARLGETESARADLQRYLELAPPNDRFRPKAMAHLQALEGLPPKSKSPAGPEAVGDHRRNGQ